MVVVGADVVVGAEVEVVEAAEAALAALGAFALGAAEVVAACVSVAAAADVTTEVAAAAVAAVVAVVVVDLRDGAGMEVPVVGGVEVGAVSEVGGAVLVPPAVVVVVVVDWGGGGVWVGSVAGMGRQRSPPSRTSSRYGGAAPSWAVGAGPARRSSTGVPVGSGRQPTSVAS
jgi:hypothetical protein